MHYKHCGKQQRPLMVFHSRYEFISQMKIKQQEMGCDIVETLYVTDTNTNNVSISQRKLDRRISLQARR